MPLLTLICSDVDFGVWRVPARNGPTRSKITLSRSVGNSSTATISENTANVALSATLGQPELGTCTVSGSQHPGQRIGVSILGSGSLTLAPASRTRLPAAAQKAQGIGVELRLSEPTVLIDAQGEGSFKVEGDFLIPGVIHRDNHGGYSTSAVDASNSLTVIVRDEVQP